MTLDEAREVLAGTAWAHETPLVALFDELTERYNESLVDGTGKERPGKVTRAFADCTLGHVASGGVVQLVISLRQQNGLPLYETVKD